MDSPNSFVSCWGRTSKEVIYFFFCIFRATLMAYGSSQARGRTGTTAISLHNYTTATATQIWAASATYTTAHSNAWSLTHWARSGIELSSLWLLVGFITTEPQHELHDLLLKRWSDFLKISVQKRSSPLLLSWVVGDCSLGLQKFPGQGMNPHNSSDKSPSSDNIRSLTCCTTRELQPSSALLLPSRVKVGLYVRKARRNLISLSLYKCRGTAATEMSCTFCVTALLSFWRNKEVLSFFVFCFFFKEIFRVILFRPVDKLLLAKWKNCLKNLDASIIHRVIYFVVKHDSVLINQMGTTEA